MGFDLNKIISKVEEKNKRKKRPIKLDIGSNYVDLSDKEEDYVVLPEWWEKFTGVKGIPFGNFVQIAGLTDCGKCHPAGTKVLMYDGTLKKVEELEPGNQLMGPDSKPRNIKTTCIGFEDIYEIIPNYGESWMCNESHILSLKVVNGCPYREFKNLDVVNMSVRDYIDLSKTKKHYLKLYKSGPIHFQDAEDLEYDPYVVGYWLGDGTKTKADITVGNDDIDFILPVFQKFASDIGLSNFKVANYISMKDRNISTVLFNNKRSERSNEYKKFLNEHCVSKKGEKKIPKHYLLSTYEKRMQLLAGLLDSDGHLNETGKSNFEIIQKSKDLSEDIVFLTRSLGLRVKMSVKHSSLNGKSYGPYYRICISGPVHKIPTKYKRKQATEPKSNRNHLVSGFAVRKVGPDNYYGFTLDGDHLYLLDNFTVTHNTSLCLETMKSALEQHGDDIFILYVETENKTKVSDFIDWGVDPDRVMITGTKIVEDCWGNIYEVIDAFFKEYPEGKMLLVFDSFAGTVSQHTADLDVFKDKTKVGGGGVAAINNQHVKRLKAFCQRGINLAALFVNSVYVNIGSHGKSIKGGETFLHECLITLLAQRTGWITKTKNKVKYKAGAKCKWKMHKNHAVKGGITKEGTVLPEAIDVEITAEGIDVVGMDYEEE